MKHKPKFFNIPHEINGYTFYESDSDQHNRVYVPRTKEDFHNFIDALYNMLPSNIQRKIQRNYNIIKRYPWLFPRNRWDGGIYLYEIKNGNQVLTWHWFNYIEGDWLEEGAPYLFFEMQEKLRKEFLSTNPDFIYLYTITDTKTKYGTVRWYDAGNTEKGHKIVERYCRRFKKEMGIKMY